MLNLHDMKLSQIYLLEVANLSASIVKKCEDLFSRYTIYGDDNYLSPDSDTHYLISSILNDAANIKKLAITPIGKNPKESKVQHRVRQLRAGFIFDSIGGGEIR